MSVGVSVIIRVMLLDRFKCFRFLKSIIICHVIQYIISSRGLIKILLSRFIIRQYLQKMA